MKIPLAAALLLTVPALTMLALPARADTHTVTVRNAGGETIRAIFFDGAAESRLRRELPPGAVARITYSTRCRTDLRIAYSSGRTEDHAGVDACTDPEIAAGSGAPPIPGATTSTATASTTTASTATGTAAARPASRATAAAVTPAKAPPPEVPPWTGRSITKRFGGME